MTEIDPATQPGHWTQTNQPKEHDMAKAKFDIKTEATRPLYAYVGATDRAVEVVRDSVADVQKRLAGVQKSVTEIDFEPKALQARATTLVNDRVDAIAKDAQARRAVAEARVLELQNRAKDTYTELVNRGESLVERIRKQESTQAAVKNAKTSSAKAKTTTTQATKATKATANKAKSGAKSTAKSTASTARKTAATPRSSAKATGTTARKTATAATKATADATKKIGD